MPHQHPKPQLIDVTARLNQDVINDLDRLLATGLFGVDYDDAAARIIERWLFDNHAHPALGEYDGK